MLYEEGDRFHFNDICPGRGGDPVCIHHVEFTDKRKHGLMSLRGGMPSVQSLYFGLLVLRQRKKHTTGIVNVLELKPYFPI